MAVVIVPAFFAIASVSEAQQLSNSPSDKSLPEFLTQQTTRMGKVIYKLVSCNEAQYYVLDQTFNEYAKVVDYNRLPLIHKEHFSTIYTEDPLIDQLLLSIDPNYRKDLNRKLSEEEKYGKVTKLFMWLRRVPVTKVNPPIDLLSLAKYFSQTGKLKWSNCINSGYTVYSLLLRLGIPRSDLAVANVPAKGPRDIQGNFDINRLIAAKRIKSANELPVLIAKTGGHYYSIIRFGNYWYPIDGLCALRKSPKCQGTVPCKEEKTISNPHRIFIAPKKNNCGSVWEVGCQEAPLGVPLVTVLNH
jgi:hypothetical protein